MFTFHPRLHAAGIMLLAVAFLLEGTRSQSNTVEDANDIKPVYCYQCNSGVDKDCPNLQVNNTNSIHYMPCVNYADYRGAKPFCRKIVQTIYERDNMVRVIRKCGWEKHPRLDCYYMNNDDHMETVCQCFSDGCNDAQRAVIASTTLAATMVVAYVLVS